MPFNPPIPERKSRGKTSGMVGSIVQAEKMVQIALILPCAVVIGWLGGAWIGGRLHQSWVGAVGIVVGGAAGLFSVIRIAMDAMKAASGGSSQEDSGKGTDGRL
jgi:ATP synthase protein I